MDVGNWEPDSYAQALSCCQVVSDESVPFSFYYNTDGIPKSCRLSGATQLRAQEDSKTAGSPFFAKVFPHMKQYYLKFLTFLV